MRPAATLANVSPPSAGLTQDADDAAPLRGLLHDRLLRRLNAATRELLRLRLALALAQADPASDLPTLRGLSRALEQQMRLASEDLRDRRSAPHLEMPRATTGAR